jgi:hypothetical protein
MPGYLECLGEQFEGLSLSLPAPQSTASARGSNIPQTKDNESFLNLHLLSAARLTKWALTLVAQGRWHPWPPLPEDPLGINLRHPMAPTPPRQSPAPESLEPNSCKVV